MAKKRKARNRARDGLCEAEREREKEKGIGEENQGTKKDRGADMPMKEREKKGEG